MACSVGYKPSATGSQTITAECGNSPGCATGTGTLYVNPATYSVTFDQTGIPTTGVTWGVTVNSVDYTGTGADIVVTGLSGTVSYSYDTPVSGTPGVEYVCSSGCSGSVSGAGTESASYTTQYSVTYQVSGCALAVTPPTSEWVISGGSATGVFPSPITTSGTQCVFVSDDRPGTITGPTVVTGTYETQYYLTVSSAYGSPAGAGWYDAGTVAGFSVTNPVSAGPGVQYAFTAWTGSGAGSYSGSDNPGGVTMDNPITETASWATQYMVTYQATGCGITLSPPSSEWVTSGGPATGVFPSPVASSGTQCIFVSDDRPDAITGPTTITGTYQTEYYLTVSSPYGSPTGAGWYDAGVVAGFGVPTSVSGGPGTQYLFSAWTGAGASSYTGSNDPGGVTMTNPITETASWTTQYSVTFAVSPSGSGTTSPSGVNQWENAGPLAISALAKPGYAFSSWAAAGSITFASSTSSGTTATVSGPGTITADFGLFTTTIVTCVPPTIAVGSTSVCTAFISGGATPTGQVTFIPSYPGKVTFISPSTCTLSSGACSVDVIGASQGNLLMIANYGGDSTHGGSSGSAGLDVYMTASASPGGQFGTCDEAAPPGTMSVIFSEPAVGALVYKTNLGNLGSGTTGLVTVDYYLVQVVGVSAGQAWVCIYSSQVTSTTVMEYYYGGWQLAYPYSVMSGKWIGALIPVAALTSEDLVTFGPPISPSTTSSVVLHTSSALFHIGSGAPLPRRMFSRLHVM